jgi:hypothetical protein
MEATLTNVIIAAGVGATVATTATLLLTRKKKKPVYTVRNVVWWIDKHVSPKMLSAPKPKVIDKIYGQYAYLTLPIQNISLNIDKLMKRTKSSRLDDDFLHRLTWAFMAKEFVGKPFLFFGILRNKYLPLKRVERKTILPESDSTLLETSTINLDVDISKPLHIPPMYFFVKVTDNLSYFILLINRNAVRLFEPAISATQT